MLCCVIQFCLIETTLPPCVYRYDFYRS